MRTLSVVFLLFTVMFDFGSLRAINVEEIADRKIEQLQALDADKKSDCLPIYNHEDDKKCGEVKKRKKQVCSEGQSNKRHDGSTEVADKSFKHHRQDYGKGDKKKDRKKNTGFTKGFDDKYHLDEKKTKNNVWSGSESIGKYMRFRKKGKFKNAKRGNKLRGKEIRKITKIDRDYPGDQFVEITWHS